MNQIYQRKQFKVYHSDNCYILHNASMDGFAHTHLDSIKQAKLLIQLSLEKRVPHDLSNYLLVSLARVNNDEEYFRKVNDLIENKRKKPEYFNSGMKRSGGNGHAKRKM